MQVPLNRLQDEDCTLESVLEDNAHTLELAKQNGINTILIDQEYKIDIDLQQKLRNLSANHIIGRRGVLSYGKGYQELLWEFVHGII